MPLTKEGVYPNSTVTIRPDLKETFFAKPVNKPWFADSHPQNTVNKILSNDIPSQNGRGKFTKWPALKT